MLNTPAKTRRASNIVSEALQVRPCGNNEYGLYLVVPGTEEYMGMGGPYTNPESGEAWKREMVKIFKKLFNEV